MITADPVSAAAPRQPEPERAVRLLWTSGWDSTFQLLRLLLEYRVPVAPYYLEDPSRASTATELHTMERIRAALNEAHPHTRELLLPLRRHRVIDLARDPVVIDALRQVRSRLYIGNQYEWLAAFCRQHELAGIELSVHVDDKVQALLASSVGAFEAPAGYRSYRMDACHAGTPEFTLFGRFDFPLFQLDKPAMAREAAREGWSEWMEMTWFCHRPLHGKPCGACAPCAYAIEEGMAWRVPRSRRMLSWFYRRFLRPLKPPMRTALTTLRRRRDPAAPT